MVKSDTASHGMRESAFKLEPNRQLEVEEDRGRLGMLANMISGPKPGILAQSMYDRHTMVSVSKLTTLGARDGTYIAPLRRLSRILTGAVSFTWSPGSW